MTRCRRCPGCSARPGWCTACWTATAAGLESGGLLVVPVTLVKGLEFDHVIVVEPARIAAAEERGLHRLYVALTRAVSRLTVLHAEPLPAPLAPDWCPPAATGP